MLPAMKEGRNGSVPDIGLVFFDPLVRGFDSSFIRLNAVDMVENRPSPVGAFQFAIC